MILVIFWRILRCQMLKNQKNIWGHLARNASAVLSLRIGKNSEDLILFKRSVITVSWLMGVKNMENRFKLVHAKKNNNIDLDQFVRDFKEVGIDAEGYILTYKNKKDNSYCILSNGLTCEEAVFSAQLIISGIIGDERDK